MKKLEVILIHDLEIMGVQPTLESSRNWARATFIPLLSNAEKDIVHLVIEERTNLLISKYTKELRDVPKTRLAEVLAFSRSQYEQNEILMSNTALFVMLSKSLQDGKFFVAESLEGFMSSSLQTTPQQKDIISTLTQSLRPKEYISQNGGSTESCQQDGENSQETEKEETLTQDILKAVCKMCVDTWRNILKKEIGCTHIGDNILNGLMVSKCVGCGVSLIESPNLFGQNCGGLLDQQEKE